MTTTMEEDDLCLWEDSDLLRLLDSNYLQLDCLGHGTFGSVYLCQKKSSGRIVALKIALHNTLDDDVVDENGNEEPDRLDAISREIQAVRKLNQEKDKEGRYMSIVYFRDCCQARGFTCIVMNYANGGTLADEIERKSRNNESYTERRIAWYIWQLVRALSFCHERNVIHHDVKSANVVIDASEGGKLLLVDFGAAVAPGEQSVAFTEPYAAPELIAARDYGEFITTHLDLIKQDAFGLGRILYELWRCQRLQTMGTDTDKTSGAFLHSQGADSEKALLAALDSSDIRLPRLQTSNENNYYAANSTTTEPIGYSTALKSLAKALLHPNPEARWAPSQLEKPLREDRESPLLAHNAAAHPLVHGAPVTMDNIQPGMFVQRGRDWEDGEEDGGKGHVGVVIRLDADALFTEIVWPLVVGGTSPPEPLQYHIGEKNKYEIAVGPTCMPNFYSNNPSELLSTAAIWSPAPPELSVGHILNDNCMIVGHLDNTNFILVAPLDALPVAPVPGGPPRALAANPPPAVRPRDPASLPKLWGEHSGSDLLLVPVTSDHDHAEWGLIAKKLFNKSEGGVSTQDYYVQSVHRIQSPKRWSEYARTRETVAAENWGVANEKRLLSGSKGMLSLATINSVSIQSLGSFAQAGFPFFDQASVAIQDCLKKAHNTTTTTIHMVLARVVLGRVLNAVAGASAVNEPSNVERNYHSNKESVIGQNGNDACDHACFRTHGPSQVYPEYLIALTSKQSSTHRRILRASRPGSSPQMATSMPTEPSQLQHDASPPFQSPRRRFVRAARPSDSSPPLAQFSSPPGQVNRPSVNQGRSPSHAPSMMATRALIGESFRPSGSPQIRNKTPTRPASVERHPSRSVQHAAHTGRAASFLHHQPSSSANKKHGFVFGGGQQQQQQTPAPVPQVARRSPGAALLSSTRDARSCMQCSVNPVTRTTVPCGHAIFCEACSSNDKLEEIQHRCPYCRQQIQEVVPSSM